MFTEQHASLEAASAVASHLKTRKSDVVFKLLRRTRGATIEEISLATDWKIHSVRAFLSGLRKKGASIVRDERKNGDRPYRIEPVLTGADTTGVVQ